MQNSTQLTSIIFTIFITITIEANRNDDVCNNTCGNKRVPYPFGFSENCLIKLDCSESSGEIKVGDFKVQNITANGVVLEIEAKCDRSIESIKPLFGQNYALSSQNSLLLQNCTKPQVDACVISTSTLLLNTKTQSCSLKSDNTSCLPLDNMGVKLALTYESLDFKGCRNVFSSIVIGSEPLGQPFWLEFERVQLDWWVNGNCEKDSCVKNAKCENFEGGKGFRCHCIDGFIGDGFKQGRGCWIGNKEEEEAGFMDMGVFSVSFVVSYIILLLGIVVVLYINPYWRRVWFRFVEMKMANCYYFVLDNCPRLFNIGT